MSLIIIINNTIIIIKNDLLARCRVFMPVTQHFWELERWMNHLWSEFEASLANMVKPCLY